MKKIPHFCIFLISCISILSCTNVVKIPDLSLLEKQNFISPNKSYNLDVLLVQNEEFKSTSFNHEGLGYVLNIGPQMSKNTHELSSLLFEKVTVVEDKDAINKSADAYLTPRVVQIERAAGAIRGDKTKTTLILEWKLEDKDKNLIWIDTVKGVGEGKVPADDTKLIELLLIQLFENSYKEISASSEIKNFAKQVSNPMTVKLSSE